MAFWEAFVSGACCDQSPSRRIRKAAVIFLMSWLAVVLSVSGQEYQQLPVDETVGGGQAALFGTLNSGGGDAAQIETFLKSYYLARWTVPDNYRQLHSFRSELLDAGLAMSSAGRTAFYGAAMVQLSEMAKNTSMAPAVRYNAVLTMAMMDESNSGDRPVPYGGAVPALVDLASAAANQPDYIVLGALIGLARQAALGIPDEGNRKAAVDLFLETLEPSYASKRHFDPDIAVWLQCRAVEGLSAFKSVSGYGEGTRILDTLRRLIEEPKTDLTILNEALRGLGEINLAEAADYDFAPLARSLAKCYRVLMEKEVRYIEIESLRGQIGTGSAMSMNSMGGMGGMGTAPRASGGAARPGESGNQDTSQVELVISEIVYGTDSLSAAMTGSDGKSGVAAVLKEDDAESKALFDDVLARIEKMKTYLTYGEDSLKDDFDPKSLRPSASTGGGTLFKVEVPGIKDYLEEQIQSFQDASSAWEESETSSGRP